MPLNDPTQRGRYPTGRRGIPPRKIAVSTGLAILGFALACLLLPDFVISPYLEGRLRRALAQAYPSHTIRIAALRYNVWTNRLGCDSVTVTAADSTPEFSAGGVEITGVDRLPLLLGEGITPDGVGDVSAEARNVTAAIARSHHVLRCASLKLSVPDSALTIDDLRYQPTAGDEEYFAGSPYRRTSYRLVVPQVRVSGLTLMNPGNVWRAGAIRAGDASLSVLVDKEKPVDAAATSPRMPAEMLKALGVGLLIDSMLFEGGTLVYRERFDVGSDPAILSCDSIQIVVEGVGFEAGGRDTAIVRGRGILMGSGAMSVRMEVPLAAPELSFRFSGTLDEMALSRLNPFIEVSEGLRLKTGDLHSVVFHIDVTAGKASGAVRAAYEDVKVVAINKSSGSEGNVVDSFISLIANNIKLRTTNMPDASGILKAGEVEYERKNDETFMEFAWFALRSGISDLVGF